MARDTELDTHKIRQHFIDGARRGATAGANAGLERIRKHAPVRKLFKGTTYKTDGGFRVPKQHRIRFGSIAGDKIGKMTTDAGESARGQAIGHANSEVPVFRFKTPNGTVLATGNFRQVRNGALVPQVPSVALRQGSRYSDVRVTPAVAAEISKRIKPTARGKFEIKSGRATFKAAGERARIGGRLKGELRVIPAGPLSNGHVWAYVESPTVDPDTGYAYPAAQEFGTVHNRAHPFMRPGLHESRNDLMNAVSRNVRAGSQ